LGDDAMIVSTRTVRGPQGRETEVVAARAAEIDAFRRRLDGARAAALRARDGKRRIGPYRVALVGPAGAGKTTTSVKVALHLAAEGTRKVGLVTLDTYRVGALEEMQTYAEIADMPLEAVYARAEVLGATERLRDRDVVVIDTPGRCLGGGPAPWAELLEAFAPDEVHLVVPAGSRPEVALSLLDRVPGPRPTHVLFTKVDELPVPTALAELTDGMALPARWVCDGPDITGDLGPAVPRILASLGLSSQPRRRVDLLAG
jgi:flagellar biosynthesis protein FlhF